MSTHTLHPAVAAYEARQKFAKQFARAFRRATIMSMSPDSATAAVGYRHLQQLAPHRSSGQVITHRDGREYQVQKDGSWRRLTPKPLPKSQRRTIGAPED